MNPTAKKILMIFPWVGMAVFAIMYCLSVIDHGLTNTYNAESFKSYKAYQDAFVAYTESRGKHSTDLEAITELDFIDAHQYNDKYAPWIITSMGLIKFDSEGSIEHICLPSIGWDSSKCPLNL